MKRVILNRLMDDRPDEGTLGSIFYNGFLCACIELPWRDNEPGKSCIPSGIYHCSYRYSPKHGHCYHVDLVPGRTDVEIHSANWAGDAAKGFKCQLLGCIAPGMQSGELSGQKAVLGSKEAVARLEEVLGRQNFELEIKWDGENPEEPK